MLGEELAGWASFPERRDCRCNILDICSGLLHLRPFHTMSELQSHSPITEELAASPESPARDGQAARGSGASAGSTDMESTEISADFASEFAQAVCALFEGPLSELEFPGVGARSLALTRQKVRGADERLELARRELIAAEELAAAGQVELDSQCERALAYARVYAEDDEVLSAEIETIEAPRRGRGRKSASRTRKSRAND